MSEQTDDLSLGKRVTNSILPSEPKAGSAMTHGAGHGNKTGEFRTDSIRGQVMEGLGGIIHSENIAEKGHELRRKSGHENPQE